MWSLPENGSLYFDLTVTYDLTLIFSRFFFWECNVTYVCDVFCFCNNEPTEWVGLGFLHSKFVNKMRLYFVRRIFMYFSKYETHFWMPTGISKILTSVWKFTAEISRNSVEFPHNICYTFSLCEISGVVRFRTAFFNCVLAMLIKFRNEIMEIVRLMKLPADESKWIIVVSWQCCPKMRKIWATCRRKPLAYLSGTFILTH